MKGLSVVVMAHPDRSTWAEGLAEGLGAEIVWDRGKGEWDTGSRALRAAGSEPYVLVLQDDAVPCTDVLVHLTRAAAHMPTVYPISLYYGLPVPHPEKVEYLAHRAAEKGSPWIRGPGPWWGVGLFMPAGFAKAAAVWGDKNEGLPYDERLARFSKISGQEWLYLFPSLVDHRPVYESPSIYENRRRNRRAVWFQDEPRHDFSKPPIAFSDGVRFQHARTGTIATAREGDPHHRRLVRAPFWKPLPDLEPEW